MTFTRFISVYCSSPNHINAKSHAANLPPKTLRSANRRVRDTRLRVQLTIPPQMELAQ